MLTPAIHRRTKGCQIERRLCCIACNPGSSLRLSFAASAGLPAHTTKDLNVKKQNAHFWCAYFVLEQGCGAFNAFSGTHADLRPEPPLSPSVKNIALGWSHLNKQVPIFIFLASERMGKGRRGKRDRGTMRRRDTERS